MEIVNANSKSTNSNSPSANSSSEVSSSVSATSVAGLSAHPLVNMRVQRMAHFKGEMCKYQSSGASGMDVRAQLSADIILQPGARTLVPTGLIFEVPYGYELQARPRSGWAIKEGMSLVNTPGTIDADYRGEVKIPLINLGEKAVVVKDQERVAQLVLCPVYQARLQEVMELSETERGKGGFGSTGRA